MNELEVCLLDKSDAIGLNMINDKKSFSEPEEDEKKRKKEKDMQQSLK